MYSIVDALRTSNGACIFESVKVISWTYWEMGAEGSIQIVSLCGLGDG